MSGYCNYCDSLTNSIIKQYDNGVLIWVGCANCFIKKKEIENDKDKKQV